MTKSRLWRAVMSNRFLNLVTNWHCDIKDVLKRFTIPLSLAVLAFITLSYMVVSSNNGAQIFMELVATFMFGYVTCTLSQILYERVFECTFKIKNFKLIYDISCLLVSLSSFLPIHYFFKSPLFDLGFAGSIILETLLILYFLGDEFISKHVSHLIKGISFNTLICSIFFIGVSVCLTAFNHLILHNWIISKYFSILGFLSVLIYQIMSLSILPKKQQELKIPKLFNIIISNLILPIYSLLLFILYVYLGKILIRRTFPSNEVNLFVSISSLLFVFLSFSLMHRKGESKFIDLFLKFGGFLIIPTILMQFASIYIRFSEYGLTSVRYVSIALNIFSLIFAVVILIRQEKGLRDSLLVLCALVILVTLTPLNLFNLPIIEQQYRLKKLLLSNGMLVDNRIIKKSEKDIGVMQGDNIVETYLYIKKNRHLSNIKCKFISEEEFSLPSHRVNEIFGCSGIDRNKEKLRGRIPQLEISYAYNQPINVGGYNQAYHLQSDQLGIKSEEVFCKIDGKEHIINGFYNYLKDFYDNNVSDETIYKQIEYEYENYKFVILRGKLLLNDKSLNLYVYEGYLLKR